MCFVRAMTASEFAVVACVSFMCEQVILSRHPDTQSALHCSNVAIVLEPPQVGAAT